MTTRFHPGTVDHDLLAGFCRHLATRGAEDWAAIPRPRRLISWARPGTWKDERACRLAAASGVPVLFRQGARRGARNLLKEVFVDGTFVPEGVLRPALGGPFSSPPTWDVLVGQGILLERHGQWGAGVRLVPLRGRWMAADPAWDLSDEAVYIGDDSVRLAGAVEGKLKGRILDAYAGTAVQGLLAASAATTVVSAEWNERALQMAALNLALNDGPMVALVRADSLRGLRGPFDWILLNPPYGSASHDARAISHRGGLRGDEETIRALSLAVPLLAPSGRVVVVGTFPVRDGRPELFEDLADRLNLTFTPCPEGERTLGENVVAPGLIWGTRKESLRNAPT